MGRPFSLFSGKNVADTYVFCISVLEKLCKKHILINRKARKTSLKSECFCGIIYPMKERKYIFIKDENGKRRRFRFIEGDKISTEELIRRLDQQRVSDLKFEMEKIRINDQLDETQKAVQRSMIEWRLKQLERGLSR